MLYLIFYSKYSDFPLDSLKFHSFLSFFFSGDILGKYNGFFQPLRDPFSNEVWKKQKAGMIIFESITNNNYERNRSIAMTFLTLRKICF